MLTNLLSLQKADPFAADVAADGGAKGDGKGDDKGGVHLSSEHPAQRHCRFIEHLLAPTVAPQSLPLAFAHLLEVRGVSQRHCLFVSLATDSLSSAAKHTVATSSIGSLSFFSWRRGSPGSL